MTDTFRGNTTDEWEQLRAKIRQDRVAQGLTPEPTPAQLRELSQLLGRVGSPA